MPDLSSTAKAVRLCLDCEIEFEPKHGHQRYCSKEHSKKARDRRYQAKRPETKTDRVIAVKGSRCCSNCRSRTAGPRFSFWWDDWDRVEEVMETAMVLCYPCFFRFNSQLAKERKRVRKWEARAEPPIPIIPF